MTDDDLIEAMMSTPDRIWLQPDDAHWTIGEWTWCWHEIGDSEEIPDIEYVRADIHAAAIDAARREGREEAARVADRDAYSWRFRFDICTAIESVAAAIRKIPDPSEPPA